MTSDISHVKVSQLPSTSQISGDITTLQERVSTIEKMQLVH